MKRPRKFYRDKEIKRRLRELRAHWKTESHYYWKHEGYKVRAVPSRKARKHPLYKELLEILPLVAPVQNQDKPEVDEYDFEGVRLGVYKKLTPLQQCCLVKVNIPAEEIIPVPIGEVPETKWYDLDPQLKELLVPRVTKRYIHGYGSSGDSSISNKIERDKIWELAGERHDRESDKCGQKAKYKKALIKYAKEEIMEML